MTIGGTLVEFVSESIKEVIEIVQDDGLRGTRTRQMERLAQGLIHVAGDIVMNPTPVELEAVLWPALNSATATYTLTDSLSDLTVVVDNGTATYTYVLRVNVMTYEGAPGEKMKLTLSCVGKTLAITSGGSLSGAPDVTNREFMFSDLGSGVTIGGTAYSIDRFILRFDNKIIPTYMQGQSATDLEPTDRVITLGLQTKYTSTEAGLLTANRSQPAIGSAITGSLAFTNGSDSLAFTMAALVATSESVTVPGRQHLRLPLNYQVFGLSSVKEVVTTIN
jgi:hypothetical protein